MLTHLTSRTPRLVIPPRKYGASSYMTSTPLPLATLLKLAIRLEPVSWHPPQAVTQGGPFPPPYYATVDSVIKMSLKLLLSRATLFLIICCSSALIYTPSLSPSLSPPCGITVERSAVKYLSRKFMDSLLQFGIELNQ